MITIYTKCKCLECGKVFSKKQLEDKSFDNRYKYDLKDYIFRGDFGIEKRTVQHWKDTEYHVHGGIACQEDMCGQMIPLNDDETPVKCNICNAEEAPYEIENGQVCYKCIWKALK